MTPDAVMKELAALASPSIKKTLLRHGAQEPIFGVKVGDLKPLAKKLKGRQDVAMALFATGNSDAMYLAGLVADGAKMSRKELDQWAAGASWHMIAGCTVAWVAAEHPEAVAAATQWIDSARELTATAGWSTLAALISIIPDEKLPVKEFAALIDRVVKTIHASPNRVRYSMNEFVICCGTYSPALADKAMAAAKKIGEVKVNMGDTACQVPEAESYILKCRRGAPVAPKRKTARC